MCDVTTKILGSLLLASVFLSGCTRSTPVGSDSGSTLPAETSTQQSSETDGKTEADPVHEEQGVGVEVDTDGVDVEVGDEGVSVDVGDDGVTVDVGEVDK